MDRDSYKLRSDIVKYIIFAIAAIFVCRLAFLQFGKKYKELSEGNAFYHKIIYAPRGAIFDRNHKLLVYNQKTYDLLVTMKELNDMAKEGHPIDTMALCKLLGESKEQIIKRFENVKNYGKNPGYTPLSPQRFATQLTPEDYAKIMEQLWKFPGFSVQSRTLRNYNYKAGSHILGSIGEVNQDQINNNPEYKLGDYIGVTGIERAYETELRGKNGKEILLRDAQGRIQGKYKDGEEDVVPVPGVDVISTLDIDLQIFAEQLLKGKRGSVVAIEPSTGEVLCIASNPTWDPEYLVGRRRATYYPILIGDKTRPLLNRALQGQYPPGSTFKTIQALVCQQLGGITESTMFPCNGPGSSPIKCTHHHGSPVSLEGALEQSCNPYFWQAYKATIEKDCYNNSNKRFDHDKFHENYDAWRNCVFSLGLGFAFEDSDIPGLKDGAISSIKTYSKIYGKKGWKAITIRSNSIGQGEVLVTPIQLANAAALIANGGWYITPHINKNDSMKTRRHVGDVDPKYYKVVQRGMWRVCEFGTGRHYKIPGYEMCGKTGTADNGRNAIPHSIFIGYAPYDNPKIAIAVVIENAGFGATWANPIASLCMEKYLTGDCSRQDLFERMSTSITSTEVANFENYIKSISNNGK